MLVWLSETWLAEFVLSHAWAQQVLETIHMSAFAIVIGAIIVLDLRLLGVGKRVPVTTLSRPIFRIAWIGFLFILASGLVMFITRGHLIIARWSFQLKLGLIALALLNLLVIQWRLRRAGAAWDSGPAPPSIKTLAAASIMLWPAAIVVARFMYAINQMTGAPR